MVKNKFLKWLAAPLALGTFAALVWLENRRPLRRSVESKTIRSSRNLAVAGIPGVFLSIPLMALLTVVYKHVLEHSGSKGIVANILAPKENSEEEGAAVEDSKSLT